MNKSWMHFFVVVNLPIDMWCLLPLPLNLNWTCNLLYHYNIAEMTLWDILG